MKKNILIVEDDALLHQFYHYIFDRAGYNIFIIEDGEKIIEKLLNENIHLIIMDINLKNTYLDGRKTDGIKLSRHIKLNAETSNIPIVLVTAYTISSKCNKLMDESLAEMVIVKPIVNYNSFLSTINKMIIN